MLSARWLALGVFLILLILITHDKGSWKQKLNSYGMTFLEGMVGGLIIDSIGVNSGYYYFPRQPLYSLNYWIIVIPCWGVFGLFLNYLWQRLGKEKVFRGAMVTLPILFGFYEGSNLITGSWIYTAPFYVVVLGWIPLGYVFAGCRHRRDVVFKIDAWIQQAENWHVKVGLQVVRALLIVVMFPLLFVSIGKVVRDLFTLRRANVSLKSYAREYLMMRSG